MTPFDVGLGIGIALLAGALYKAHGAPTPPSGPGATSTFAYAVQDGKLDKTARYDGDASGGRMTFFAAGALNSIACTGITPASPRIPPTHFAYARNLSTTIATMAYVVLYALQAWGYDYGTEFAFTVDGRDFVGKLEIHNDGPTGPRPFDHPGIDLFERVEGST